MHCHKIQNNMMKLHRQYIMSHIHNRLHCAYQQAHMSTEAHSHSTVHQTGRFDCLIPAVCSLHHRCRSLQSCRLYWRDCVDHLWEYQDHHSQWLGKRSCISMATENVACWIAYQCNLCDESIAINSFIT